MPRKYCNPCRDIDRCEYDRCKYYKSSKYYCCGPPRVIRPGVGPQPGPPPPPPVGEQAHLVLSGVYDEDEGLVVFSLINDGQLPAAGTIVVITNDSGVILDVNDIVVSNGTVDVDADGNIIWTVGDLPINQAPLILSFPFDEEVTFTGEASTTTVNNPDQSTATVNVGGSIGIDNFLIEAEVDASASPNVLLVAISNQAPEDAEDVVITLTPSIDLPGLTDVFVMIGGAPGNITPDPITGVVDINVPGGFPINQPGFVLFALQLPDPIPAGLEFTLTIVSSNLPTQTTPILIE